jgi:DNA polymerase elongation subunit (family B)
LDFYTNVSCSGNKILYRGIKNGKRVTKRVGYSPTLFMPQKGDTGYYTVRGETVFPLHFETISEARDFYKAHEDLDNSTVYGNTRFEYAYIADNFPGEIEFDRSKILIANIDIEVDGFTTPEEAAFPVTAISYKRYNEILVFGLGDFKTDRDDVRYFKFKDEEALLRGFLRIWTSDYPDIITGWNVKFFDIPYLYNRINMLFGEDDAKTLSPWKRTGEKFNKFMGREQRSLTLQGVAILDYLELYRKFAKEGMQQESYKLDHIAHVEIGEKKVDYTEYGNLMNLYRENHQLFIEYNIHDVELVGRMDERGKNCAGLLDLALTLAYDSKSNYDDVFQQVRMWDAIVFNHLKARKQVLPPSKVKDKESYDGGYVKDPKIGLSEWVCSFDLNSLYPHLIMQYNISPDTIVDDVPDALAALVAGGLNRDTLLAQDLDTSVLRDYNVTVTPNGQFFTREFQGFLPAIMQQMYDGRVRYKNKAIEAKKELVEIEAEINRRKQSGR